MGVGEVGLRVRGKEHQLRGGVGVGGGRRRRVREGLRPVLGCPIPKPSPIPRLQPNTTLIPNPGPNPVPKPSPTPTPQPNNDPSPTSPDGRLDLRPVLCSLVVLERRQVCGGVPVSPLRLGHECLCGGLVHPLPLLKRQVGVDNVAQHGGSE
eukprot:scaffold7021_cov120-Isochrysis_galbana.AAC.2